MTIKKFKQVILREKTLAAKNAAECKKGRDAFTGKKELYDGLYKYYEGKVVTAITLLILIDSPETDVDKVARANASFQAMYDAEKFINFVSERCD